MLLLIGSAFDKRLLAGQPASLTTSTHPRLFLTAAEIATRQAQATSTHREIWRPIHAYVQAQIGTRPPASAPLDADETTYRLYGDQLIAFAFACVITSGTDECNLAKAYLLTYSTWSQWDQRNFRDLGVGHLLLGNTLAYDWLYDRLSEVERAQVRQSLADWAQKLYEASTTRRQDAWNNWWHSSYVQNHHWVNNSSLGMAGLALLGEDERAQQWIDQAAEELERVKYLLEGIQDGSWHEGLPYQGYGLTMLLPFLTNLKSLQGVDLLPHHYLQNYVTWRLYNQIPNSTELALPYADFEWYWSTSHRPQNVLRFIAATYQNGTAEWLAQQLIAAEGRSANVWSAPWYVFEFLYYNPAIGPQGPADSLGAKTFPDLGAVIWRTGWAANDLVFSLKAGAYGGQFAFDTFVNEAYPWSAPCRKHDCQLNMGHAHDDDGSFTIYRAGQWLVPEVVGYEKYATDLHNTLLIDGQGQYRPPYDNFGKYPADFVGSAAALEASAATTNFSYLAADLSGRYKQFADLGAVTRQVLFVEPTYFVMVDHLAAAEPHTYEWVSHFGQEVARHGGWILGSAGVGQAIAVGVATPEQFDFVTGTDGYPYVRLRTQSPTPTARFTNLLYPTSMEQWEQHPTITAYEASDAAVALRIQQQDATARQDEILLINEPAAKPTDLGPYTFDGQVAVIQRDDAGPIRRIFVFGGTTLTEKASGTVLLDGLNPHTAVEVSYTAEEVKITGNVSNRLRLYAPQVKQLLVNDQPRVYIRTGHYIALMPTPYELFLSLIRR